MIQPTEQDRDSARASLARAGDKRIFVMYVLADALRRIAENLDSGDLPASEDVWLRHALALAEEVDR